MANKRQVDWTKEYEDWNLACPFCDGTGYKNHDALDGGDKEKVAIAYRVENDIYYEEVDIEDVQEWYDRHRSSLPSDLEDSIDAECDECSEGYVEPMWNTAWQCECEPSEDVVRNVERRTACLVLYNCKEDEWYITLGACGMDLTPDLALAWYLIHGYMDQELTVGLRADYSGNISEEDHAFIIERAADTMEGWGHMYAGMADRLRIEIEAGKAVREARKARGTEHGQAGD
jgi:hypothetical protein